MEDAIRKAMGFSWMAKVSETEGETVNKNFVVNTDRGKYFIKWNNLPNVTVWSCYLNFPWRPTRDLWHIKELFLCKPKYLLQQQLN